MYPFNECFVINPFLGVRTTPLRGVRDIDPPPPQHLQELAPGTMHARGSRCIDVAFEGYSPQGFRVGGTP